MISFFLIWMACISFSCLFVLVKNVKTVFNKSDNNGHSCLIPYFWGGAFSFSLLSMILVMGLSCAMLSCFSCVWLCATLWTVACQAPLSMGFPSKNTGVGCHVLLHGSRDPGSSRSRDQNCISWISCIVGRFFTAEPPGKPWACQTWFLLCWYMFLL